ncbi:MAG: peptidylprolyl isomerase [Gemmatimonadaceae bacterium]
MIASVSRPSRVKRPNVFSRARAGRKDFVRISEPRLSALRLCALGILASGSVACAGSGASSSAASATGNAEVQLEARLLRMTDLRILDTVLVDGLLDNASTPLRARTALAIGQVKGRARYARLRQLLVDSDTAVAANAAFALGLGKDTSAIVALARAFAGAADPVAIEAAWSLGDLGDPARAVLTLALGDGTAQPLVSSTAAQRNAPVRAAIITATSKLRSTPTAVLLPWLNDPDPQVVRAAAYVLARSRAAGGVRALAALRNSTDEETRQHVARALAKSAAGDSLSSRALDALNVLVTDTSARVRTNAVRSLATYGNSARETLLRALRDSDGNVRVATAEVLLPLLGTDAAAWKSAWAIDSTLPVRILMLTGARRVGSLALQASEDAWKMSSDWRQRSAVLSARRADTAHVTRLNEVAWALTDADGRVREVAAGLLRDVPNKDASVRDSVNVLWLGMLSDPDVQVRSTALRSLAPTANARRVPAVIDGYTRSLKDVENDARLAAIVYVRSAWDRDSAAFSSEMRTKLTGLAIPKDSAERAAARNTTPLAAWIANARPVVTSRPISDYEAVVRRYVIGSAKPATAVLHTERGDIVLALSGRETPLTVDNFVQLSKRGYYRNTYFHRVVPNFVAQDGDPRGDGSGGPGYAIRDEPNRQIHTRGCLAMALSGPDTGGSQYYMCHSPQPHLDGHYTVFGHIVAGYDVLDRIVQTDRILSIEIR